VDSGTAPSTTPAVPAGAGGYDMGARRFGPDLGSFLQQDQYAGALADLGLALDPLTQNRYALAGGNPISYVEWDGHIPTPDNPVSANPTLNVQLNTAPSPSSGAYAASREAGAGTATGAGSEAACENLGVCRLSLRSTPQSSQSFLQQPAHAPCGARDWAEGFHNSPLTLDFGSNCLIQMMASPAPGINITVPGPLNLSGGGAGGGRKGLFGEPFSVRVRQTAEELDRLQSMFRAWRVRGMHWRTDFLVYAGVDSTGRVRYVGKTSESNLTDTLYRDLKKHPELSDIQPIVRGLTEPQAIALETNLIRRYRPLLNDRVSMREGRADFPEAMQWADEFLREHFGLGG